MTERSDEVNCPAHYNAGPIECISAMESALGAEAVIAFCQGNAFKYIWRAGRKGDRAVDLRKAAWYATRAADMLGRQDANLRVTETRLLNPDAELFERRVDLRNG